MQLTTRIGTFFVAFICLLGTNLLAQDAHLVEYVNDYYQQQSQKAPLLQLVDEEYQLNEDDYSYLFDDLVKISPTQITLSQYIGGTSYIGYDKTYFILLEQKPTPTILKATLQTGYGKMNFEELQEERQELEEMTPLERLQHKARQEAHIEYPLGPLGENYDFEIDLNILQRIDGKWVQKENAEKIDPKLAEAIASYLPMSKAHKSINNNLSLRLHMPSDGYFYENIDFFSPLFGNPKKDVSKIGLTARNQQLIWSLSPKNSFVFAWKNKQLQLTKTPKARLDSTKLRGSCLEFEKEKEVRFSGNIGEHEINVQLTLSPNPERTHLINLKGKYWYKDPNRSMPLTGYYASKRVDGYFQLVRQKDGKEREWFYGYFYDNCKIQGKWLHAEKQKVTHFELNRQ